METISLVYKTKEQMLSFIKTNELESISNLLIRASLLQASLLDIKQLQKNINEMLPKATLIGSSVVNLEENNLPQKTILIFSIFPEINIQSNVFDYERDSKFLIKNEYDETLISIDSQQKTLNKTFEQPFLDEIKKIINKNINIYVFNNFKISSNGFAIAKFHDFSLYVYTNILSYSSVIRNNYIISQDKEFHTQVLKYKPLLEIQHNTYPDFTEENQLNELLQTTEVNKMALIAVPKILSILQIYGYTIFKDVLNNILQYLKKFIPNSCKLFSISGYMFAIVVKEDTNIQCFEDMINKLQKEFKEKDFHISNCTINMNMVISLIKKTGTYSNGMFENSIATLNYAIVNKKELVNYDKHMDLIKEIKNKFEVICKIKDAIKNNRIVPYFQPVRNNKTKRISGYESLIRLIDEKGKVYNPLYFLEIAKEEGLYKEITIIMINKTFKAFEDTDYQYSINLSTKDIEDNVIKDLICHKLRKCKKPQNVIFEFVESEGINDFDYMYNFILNIKKYGARIAIDDFGSGYSNLIYLMKLNSDYIKIDGNIIKNILSDKVTRDLVKIVIDVVHNLGQEVIAEHVDNKETQKLLEEFGADFTQGYLYGIPQPEIK